jgi:hypothetical protein
LSNVRALEATRLAKFALWSKNFLKSILRDEREKLIKDLDFYQTKNQHELDIFLKKYVQVFEIRFVTYCMSIDRVQYAQMWFIDDIFDVWNWKYDFFVENFFWEFFKNVLQKHIASQKLRMFDVDQKFKKLKQRSKQFVSQLCAHFDNLENQFSTMFSKHQSMNNLLFAFHSYIHDEIIRKHENCITKMQMKETILFIKCIELNFDMSKRYRRENSQNLKRSRSQITINKSIAHASSRRFNSVERERD